MQVRGELVAVVLAVDGATPYVLASGDPARLPSGSLSSQERSLQESVRSFAAQQAGRPIGYLEQLYTFADADRVSVAGADPGRIVSISYLGLTRLDPGESHRDWWRPIYDLLPWEDHRDAQPPILGALSSDLLDWAGPDSERRDRVNCLLGLGEQPWRPELALQRYELLWEAQLLPESRTRPTPDPARQGEQMLHDHRRILATGLARARSMLQYRPMVFEMVPDTFTLGRLQEVVESLAGQPLHTQNFRRLIEQQHQLVEPTGRVDRSTGGRPARLYRYRAALVRERQHVGTKLPLPRAR
ncbi:MAG TPA: hypothetical protein PLO27_01550 [Marmoricola sp.]|nr:hypothetical protein [Marmoricola sp.]